MSCIHQPSSTEIKLVDGLFFKSMEIKNKHTLVPQHKHVYDHISFVAVGSVRLWKNDILIGDFTAPNAITIEKNKFHKFLSLENNTIVWCIHNIKDADKVEIEEENQLNLLDYKILSGLN